VALAAALWIASIGAPAAAPLEQEAAALFSEGNEMYAAGKYDEAARQYRQLLNLGISTAAVHYNLGGALFKARQLGPAILEYEKAARLDTGDADIQANLSYLRSLTADKSAEVGAQTTSFFVERLLAITSIDQDAAAFVVAWVALGVLAAARLAARSRRLRYAAAWGMVLVALPVLTEGAIFSTKLYRAATLSEGIVLEERVDVRSGPGEENTTLFTVHEGLKVRVRSRQGSWLQVSLDNGLNGWMSASSLGVI
jgi:tetratricopeptide (TPR) repeat protein